MGWCVRWVSRMLIEGTTRPRDALGVVAIHLADLGKWTPQSIERLTHDMGLFVARLELIGVDDIRETTASQVVDFIDEAVRVDEAIFRDPALGTRHFRRTAVREFFRMARALGLCTHDPTIDVVLPLRTERSTRALTDDEIAAGEAASRNTLDATRLPAAWALAEASAITSEIAALRVKDVDLEGGRVWLDGAPNRRRPRWGELTEWGVRAIHSRIRHLGAGNGDFGVVYGGFAIGKSPSVSVGAAVHEVLVLSGLNRLPNVRPLSVPFWAGATAFETTGRVDVAANVMGLTSLDRTAQALGWTWQS